jgi:hypothetical protein
MGFEPLAVMQQLIEIQKDIAHIKHTTDDIRARAEALETTTSDLKGKVVRAEIIGATLAGVLIVVAAVFWWLFAAPITYIRDQVVNQHPAITEPDKPKS